MKCSKHIMMPEMLLAMMVLLSGCSLLESDERMLSLETDLEVYDLGATEVIKVEAENTSSAVIYFSTCMPTTLEEREDSQVVATLGFPVCQCTCRAELEPGETWNYSVSVDWIEEHKDRLQLREDNTYRLQLAFFQDREMRHLLDEEALYTNRFKFSQ